MTTTSKTEIRYKRNIAYKSKEFTKEYNMLVAKQNKFLELPLLKQAGLVLTLKLILEGKIKAVSYVTLERIDNEDLVLMYLKGLIDTTARALKLKRMIDMYDRLDIKEKTFKFVFNTIHKEFSKDVLRGGKHSLGYRLGSIEVLKKKKYYGGKYNNKSVNWKESLAQLKIIAQTASKETKDIYADYQTDKLNRTEFIQRMKCHVYHKTTRPDAPKWLIYNTDDYAVWWIWHKKHCSTTNYNWYSFTPTNFINMVDEKGMRSQIYASETMTIEELIETDFLGNRDKMNCIYRKDPYYFKGS